MVATVGSKVAAVPPGKAETVAMVASEVIVAEATAERAAVAAASRAVQAGTAAVAAVAAVAAWTVGRCERNDLVHQLQHRS